MYELKIGAVMIKSCEFLISPLFFTSVCLSATTNGVAIAQPNIILCMTDDQGWGDTGYNGHPYLKTPHIDQMSREGVTFHRFYSAAAMCSPTRASCYTGRNPYRMGVTFAMKGMLEEREVPITTVLKQAGYTTGHFGKWHLGTLSKKQGDQKRWGDFATDPKRYYCPPWERDVDVCFVTESKVPTWDPLITPEKIHPKDVDANTGKPYGNDYFTGPEQTVTENTDGDDSRVIMDRALPFIQSAVDEGKPFLAVIWFHTPHSPIVGGSEYRQMYSQYSEDEQHYYACLTAMDEQIGRLRTELKRLGVSKNTMLWFCSDNGPARQGSPRHVGSTGGLSGYKLSINEGGIRVPGILVWPKGIQKPLTIDAPCVTSDYFPTILDVLGIPLPNDRTYDGISLLPLLRGECNTRGKPIGFLNKEGKEAVWMDDRYKLIIDSKRTRLFDIPTDPAEKTDLSEVRPEVTLRMRAELEEWRDGVMKELELVTRGREEGRW
jgi:arylsulfatase A-like enzyme